MNAAQHQGRAEAAAARRRHLSGILSVASGCRGCHRRLRSAALMPVGAGVAGIDRPAVGIVASQCERLGGQSRRVRQAGDSRCRTLSTVAAQAAAASAPFTRKWS